jgi:hypothetical protein
MGGIGRQRLDIMVWCIVRYSGQYILQRAGRHFWEFTVAIALAVPCNQDHADPRLRKTQFCRITAKNSRLITSASHHILERQPVLLVLSLGNPCDVFDHQDSGA